MLRNPPEIALIAQNLLLRNGQSDDVARFSGHACAFLESVGYPGLKILRESLTDPLRNVTLTRDAMGLDLQNVSCVFLGPALQANVVAEGRVFLRNVRHGLYLLQMTVALNIGIGCPVDPGFAIGGERTKNPYAEKLAHAEKHGVLIDDDDVLRALEAL